MLNIYGVTAARMASMRPCHANGNKKKDFRARFFFYWASLWYDIRCALAIPGKRPLSVVLSCTSRDPLEDRHHDAKREIARPCTLGGAPRHGHPSEPHSVTRVVDSGIVNWTKSHGPRCHGGLGFGSGGSRAFTVQIESNTSCVLYASSGNLVKGRGIRADISV
jgi:hypothetical protein